MKKKRFIILVIIIVIIAGIQFIPVEKPVYIAENQNDLITNNTIPEDITAILKKACYDCHSNETAYPWYSYVYPVKILVYKDVKEGREVLNFSDWELFKKLDKATILNDMAGEVLEGEMPVKIYTRMHSKANLTNEQKEKFVSWTEDFADSLFN